MKYLFLLISFSLILSSTGIAEELDLAIDGNNNDWNSEPLVKEIGDTGRGSFDTEIDATQLYVNNDAKYLYFFFGTRPSFAEKYVENKTTGSFCDVYIDIDNNPNSGCRNVTGFSFGKITGYEFKLWMPIGQYATATENGTFASYSLLEAKDDGSFSLSNPILEERSLEDTEFIAHGRDGVEMKVPLDILGIKIGDHINLLIVENTHIFTKEGYTKTQYTLK